MAARSGEMLQTKFFYVASILAVSLGFVSLMWRFRGQTWILVVFGLVWVVVVTAFAWEIVTRAERLDSIVRSRTDALEESNRHLSNLLQQLSAFQSISYEMNQKIAVKDITVAFTKRLCSLLPDLEAVWLWLDVRLVGTGRQQGKRQGSGAVRLRLAARSGQDFGRPPELVHLRADNPLVARCFDGHSVAVNHYLKRKALAWGWRWLQGSRVESFAAFPLKLGDRVLGLLGVFSRRNISAEFVSQLHLNVNQLTMALEKARLLKAMRARAEELVAANAELRQLDAMKDWFVSAVSHELRTPLTNIRSFSEILENYDDLAPEERTEFASVISRESERLSEMIDDVLDLAQMANGEMRLEPAEFDLADLVAKSCRPFSHEADERGIAFTQEVSDRTPGVFADQRGVARVLNNLIGNAFKFTPDGGSIRVAVEPAVSGSDGSKFVTVQIRDTGVGIAQKDQEKIFDRFTQAGSHLTNKAKGTGIGLAICREIVEKSHGEIWVESEPGKGSTFRFTLPAVSAS